MPCIAELRGPAESGGLATLYNIPSGAREYLLGVIHPPQRPTFPTCDTETLTRVKQPEKLQHGGGLLMVAAPKTTNHSESTLPSTSPPGRQGGGGGSKPSTAGNAAGDAAALGERGFEPFVQLASWGHGSFTPLAQFTSGGLLLGGGGGGESGWGAWGVPYEGEAAVGARAACLLGSGQEKSCYHRGRGHSIRTGEGGLEIAPAEGKQSLLQQRGLGCGSH